MKKINFKKLAYNQEMTDKIRQRARNTKKVKITFNLDADTLKSLKILAELNGGSYQKLMNKILTDAISNKSKQEDRLDYLEKEFEKIKKKLSA